MLPLVVDPEVREDVTAEVRALDHPRAGVVRLFLLAFQEAG